MSRMTNVRELLSPEDEAVELCSRLLTAAGFDPNHLVMPEGGKFNTEFLSILRTLAYIGARKTDLYGDFRMQDIRNADRELWGAYWDIQRKYGRVDTQLQNKEGFRRDDVIESCGDLAVYAVRMIQIIRRLEEKGML